MDAAAELGSVAAPPLALAQRVLVCFSEAPEGGPMNDRDVYMKLAAMADELTQMAQAAETFVGNAALTTCAQTLAGAAKAVYEHAMEGEEH